MKKILILGMAVFLVFGFTSWATAEFYGNTYESKIPIFWAVNGDGTSSTVSLISTNVGGVRYSLTNNGTDWTTLPSSLNVNGGTKIFLQSGGVSSTVLMTYQAKLYPAEDNSPLYKTLIASFNGYTGGFSISTAEGTNGAISPVPLPGAVWLLGTGLIGLVGVRRRFQS
jgi:hypothetical protein